MGEFDFEFYFLNLWEF